MADAVLSVEVRAKLEQLSKGLGQAEKSIEDFVNRGDRHISVIEQRFSQMGKSTKEIAENIKSSFGGISLEKYFQQFGNSKAVIESAKGEIAKYKEEIERLKKVGQDLNNQIKEKNKLLGDSKVVTENQRKATESERTETQRLQKELVKLRLEKAQVKKETIAATGSYREAQLRLTVLGKAIRENANGFNLNSKEVKIQVAEYNKLNAKLKEFDAAMGNHQRNVGNYSKAWSSVFPLIGQLTSVAGAGILAVRTLNDAKKTIFDFNNGLLNVSKTTGLSGKELNDLSDDIVKMSRTLQTVGTPKLLEYATVAGQLGVKGRQNILSFSEALAKLETASNITGEQGGAEIARLLTLVDGGVQNVSKFGDEIVNLGNNFAATEKEILGNAESIAQNVGIYRIGRQEVLAFATATKAVGIEAELVGSTFNRTLAIFEKAIRTGEGLDVIIKAIGGSQASLSKRFKDDAAGVFVDYIKSLNQVYKSGGSVNEQMEAIGINAVRDQRVISSLASNGYEVLASALDTVRNSAGAMDREYTTASEKLIKQTERIGIAWDNLILTIENGEGAIGKSTAKMSGFFANVLESITDLVKESTNLGDIFAAFSPGYIIDAALEKGRNQENMKGRAKGNFAFENFAPSSSLYKFEKFNEVQQDVVSTQQELSDAVVKNKQYWEGQVKSLNDARNALDASKRGTKEWIDLTNKLNAAQSQLGAYSDKKSIEKLTLKTEAKEREKLNKIILDSFESLNKRELTGIQKTVEAINQKYSGWKRQALESVKVSSDASEVIKQLEINNKAETAIAIDKIVKDSIAKRTKDEKKAANDIAEFSKKAMIEATEVELVFSRKFDETASQRSIRLLNAEYKKLADQLQKELRGQVSFGVNVDSDARENALQEEYFAKSEALYRKEQAMRLDMVDARNLFNRSLEKTNILLDDNSRKLQAGAISVEEFQKVQTELLNTQDNLNELKTIYQSFTSGVSDAFSGLVMGTENFADSMENVVKNLVSSLIQQMMRLATIKLFGALLSTVTGGVGGAVIGAATSSIGSFSKGGYTGNIGANKPAGIVHGNEFVFDAQSTKRLGVDNLKSLQSGKIPTVSDFTPIITKNNSNFNYVHASSGKQQVDVRVAVEGQQRNNVTKLAVVKATRYEKKFGRG